MLKTTETWFYSLRNNQANFNVYWWIPAGVLRTLYFKSRLLFGFFPTKKFCCQILASFVANNNKNLNSLFFQRQFNLLSAKWFLKMLDFPHIKKRLRAYKFKQENTNVWRMNPYGGAKVLILHVPTTFWIFCKKNIIAKNNKKRDFCSF